MTDLIERLEAATEGSRELDKIIKDEFVGFDPDHDLPKHWPMVGEPGPPHYTTSIGAALTLESDRPRRIRILQLAVIELISHELGIEHLPRFICIVWFQLAALKARQGDDHG